MKLTTNNGIKSILLLLCLITSVTYAIPAIGDTIVVKQPDGTPVKVRVFGDEFYRRVESLDGYTIVKNSDGWICYAARNRSADTLTATAHIYSGTPIHRDLSFEKHIDISDDARAKRREEERYKLWGDGGPGKEPVRQQRGEIVGATILIDFPDDTATISVQDMDDFMNKPGFKLFGNNGSVRDYFLDMSQGKLDYKNKVVGYYRAQHPKSYYEENNLKLVLIDEAYRSIDKIFDFTQCTFNIKAVKAINILYAGPCNSAWGQGLWPHAGQHRYETDEGLVLSSYQMAAIDTGLTIGPTVHENAHMLLNLKDLYDSKGESYGVGYYCLMCYGCFVPNPTPINAYFRHLAGWETPVDISNATDGTVYGHKMNSMSSFIYKNPRNTKEFFFIESRRRAGRNLLLPDEGLMIWHVDGWAFSQNPDMTPSSHFYVSLEQADGLYDMEKKVNAGDTNDLFIKGIAPEFGPEGAPNSDWWKDGKSGFALSNVSGIADTMYFTFGEGHTPVTKAVMNSGDTGPYMSIANGILQISSAGDNLERVILYNSLGREIFSQNAIGAATLSLREPLSQGMYLILVETEKKRSFMKKLVLQ